LIGNKKTAKVTYSRPTTAQWCTMACQHMHFCLHSCQINYP